MKLSRYIGLGIAALVSATPVAAETPATAKAAEPILDSRIDSARVQDILELERLKALYFYYLDNKKWDAWQSLFTKDARLLVDREDEKGKGVDVTAGMDKVIVYVRERLEVTPSVHQGHTPIYTFTSANEAAGIWAMSDIIYYQPDKVLYGYGHYRETYRKEDGVWKFASVHLTRLAVDVANPVKR